MGSTHPLDALRRADEANKPYLLSPSFFQPVHRRDRSIRSSKDRSNHNYEPLAEIGWRFEKILDRNESLRLAIKADMRHSRSWNEIEHSFRKCHASTKDRGKYELLAGDAWSNHTCERRLDLDIRQRQIARYLVAQQHPYLFEKLPKGLGGTVFVSDQREFVLHQWMVDDGDAFHDFFPYLGAASLFEIPRCR
jgi:hypothetical protein